MLHLVEKIIEIGVDEITIADTVGYANPKQVKMLFNSLIRSVGNLDIFAHFHEPGLGMANVLTAFDLGIRKFDSSLLGLGGCPFAPGASGNVATEDIIYLFNSMKISTGIDLKDLIILCKNIRKFFKSEVLSGKFYQLEYQKTLINVDNCINNFQSYFGLSSLQVFLPFVI